MFFLLLGCLKTPQAPPAPQVRYFVHDSARSGWQEVDDLELALDTILSDSTEAETLTVHREPGGWLVRAESRSMSSDMFTWGEHRFSEDGTLKTYQHHEVSYGWY